MMGNHQSTIGAGQGDSQGSENGRDGILDQLPPEKLLETTNPKLLRGGLQCMHTVETVKQYVAYENGNAARPHVLKQLQARAAEIQGDE